MVFAIHVIYKAPSTERLFLGTGWGGVRFARGPYLSVAPAEIVIDNWALSSKLPATVKLTLSVSNRCEVDALFVRATGAFGSAQTLVKRNDEAILTLCDIFSDPIRNRTVVMLEPTFGPGSGIAATGGSLDIVALATRRAKMTGNGFVWGSVMTHAAHFWSKSPQPGISRLSILMPLLSLFGTNGKRARREVLGIWPHHADPPAPALMIGRRVRPSRQFVSTAARTGR